MEFVIGFILGVIAGFVSNILFEKYKERTASKDSYIKIFTKPEHTEFQGKISNNPSAHYALTELKRSVEE